MIKVEYICFQFAGQTQRIVQSQPGAAGHLTVRSSAIGWWMKWPLLARRNDFPMWFPRSNLSWRARAVNGSAKDEDFHVSPGSQADFQTEQV